MRDERRLGGGWSARLRVAAERGRGNGTEASRDSTRVTDSHSNSVSLSLCCCASRQVPAASGWLSGEGSGFSCSGSGGSLGGWLRKATRRNKQTRTIQAEIERRSYERQKKEITLQFILLIQLEHSNRSSPTRLQRNRAPWGRVDFSLQNVV